MTSSYVNMCELVIFLLFFKIDMENCYKNIFIFLQICDTMSWWKKERGEKIEKEFGNGCIFYA